MAVGWNLWTSGGSISGVPAPSSYERRRVKSFTNKQPNSSASPQDSLKFDPIWYEVHSSVFLKSMWTFLLQKSLWFPRTLFSAVRSEGFRVTDRSAWPLTSETPSTEFKIRLWEHDSVFLYQPKRICSIFSCINSLNAAAAQRRDGWFVSCLEIRIFKCFLKS